MADATDTVVWARRNLPALDGRRALVTGAASGLGFETALGLAACGARVILADCNVEGGEAAARDIGTRCGEGHAEFRVLDLADLSQARKFANDLLTEAAPVDLLVNNAGILPPLQRRTTHDGFELKFGINVLGHFALTGLLLPALLRAAEPRVVTVSSLVHRRARIDFDDLHGERHYAPQRAYNQAKLACLIFALELQARSERAGTPLSSVAAHPGIARTALGDSRRHQQRHGIVDHVQDLAFWIAMHVLSQPQQRGARCILHAAAELGVKGGEFYGPHGFGEMRGEPVVVSASKSALDPQIRQRLWNACEQLTGVRYALAG